MSTLHYMIASRDLPTKEPPPSVTMGELTRSMERKWSCDMSAVRNPVVSHPLSSYEVLRTSPCFPYIKFLLGGRPVKHDTLDEANLTTKQKICRIFRFFIPSILLFMFSLDCGDWIVNGEADLHLQQTRIISMLTYLDSQFGLWLGMATTFVFIAKTDKFIYCIQSLGKSMTQFMMLARGQKRRRKVTLAWILISALAVFSIFRGVYGIWEASNPTGFWLPRKYFVWRLPSGLVAIILRIFFFMSEVSAMPIYVVFIFVCARFTDCFEALTEGDQILVGGCGGEEFGLPDVFGAAEDAFAKGSYSDAGVNCAGSVFRVAGALFRHQQFAGCFQ